MPERGLNGVKLALGDTAARRFPARSGFWMQLRVSKDVRLTVTDFLRYVQQHGSFNDADAAGRLLAQLEDSDA